jgi:hypothetical protein
MRKEKEYIEGEKRQQKSISIFIKYLHVLPLLGMLLLLILCEDFFLSRSLSEKEEMGRT